MRRPVNARKHARKFNKGARRTRAINRPRQIMRGGIRL